MRAEGAAVPQPGTYGAGGRAGRVLPAAPDVFPAPGSVPERHPAPLLRPGAAPGLPGAALLLQVPHPGSWGTRRGSCQVGLAPTHPCLCPFPQRGSLLRTRPRDMGRCHPCQLHFPAPGRGRIPLFPLPPGLIPPTFVASPWTHPSHFSCFPPHRGPAATRIHPSLFSLPTALTPPWTHPSHLSHSPLHLASLLRA